MKTKTKQTSRSVRKGDSTRRTRGTRGRGVNTDEQNRVTNASSDDDEIENRSESIPNVEEEEDREKQRRLEDDQGE